VIFTNRQDAVEYAQKWCAHEPNWTFRIAHVKVVNARQNMKSEIFWWPGRDLKKTRTLVVTEGTEGYVVMFNTEGKNIKDTRFMEERLGVQLLELFSLN